MTDRSGTSLAFSVGTFVTVLGAVVGAAIYVTRLDARQLAVEEAQKRADTSVQAIRTDIKTLGQELNARLDSLRDEVRSNGVTREYLAVFMQLLQAKNPEIDVPEPPGNGR